MIEDEFSFEMDDQIVSCQSVSVAAPTADVWWWFSVSGDPSRYAPFRRSEDDCQATVQTRIVRYYRAVMERNGYLRHPYVRPWWGRR